MTKTYSNYFTLRAGGVIHELTGIYGGAVKTTGKPEACSALKGHHTGGAESPPNHLPTVSGHKLLSGWLFSASFHWLTRKRVYQFFYSHLFIR